MFKFKISGAYDAKQIIDTGWPTCVVTVIQRGADFESVGPHHLVVHMSDVFSPELSKDAPNPAHLMAILNHTLKLTSADRLLVNCWAGQSRSTAAAVAILIQHGCGPQTAFDMVLEERPVALPNQLLIDHADEHFDLGGELSKIVTAHRKSELAATYIQHSQVQPPGADEVDEVKRIMALIANGGL